MTVNKTTITALPYETSALAPVMSAETLEYHYEHLAKAYAEKLTNNIGDINFNEAGVILHNVFFEQLQAPVADNTPVDESLATITQMWTTFETFKSEIERIALTMQGSGWIMMDRDGGIVNFPNHAYSTAVERPENIILLLDLWEHAWALDYKWNKLAYVQNFWQIINWQTINERLRTP
jgi:Fe-Mn family superoxide dismutase